MVDTQPSTSDRSISIRRVVPDGGTTPAERAWLARAAASVLEDGLAPSLRDDRFVGWTPPDDLVAAVAMADSDAGARAVGYLGGTINRGRLQLDALVVPRAAGAHRGPPVGESEADILERLYDALEPEIARATAETVELWGRPERPWHRPVAELRGFAELRGLHQLRCSLPVDAEAVATRPFVPGQDEEALLQVNNRAFAAHPDQGGLTIDDLAAVASEPWFRPAGIRLYDDPEDPSRLAGFCWTKIHEPAAPGEPALGEIYAIGVDPDHRGRGLGRPVTAAGLHWLATQGLRVGMLYVETDNEPALQTYDRLGFERHRTDRAWSKPIGVPSEATS